MEISPFVGSALLEAAVENVDDVSWVFWSLGICAVYEEAGSVLAFYPDEDRGFLLKGIGTSQVLARTDDLLIITDEQVFVWNGRESLLPTSIPSWQKMDANDEGFCGWSDFRSHLHLKGENYILPMAATSVRLLADGLGAFWEYWGTIYHWQPHRLTALEVIDEDYERLLPLKDGWLAAIYERRISVIHPKYPKREWSDSQLLDVISSSDQSCLHLLLSDGLLLEWNPAEQDEPEELAEVSGEIFIGTNCVLDEAEIICF